MNSTSKDGNKSLSLSSESTLSTTTTILMVSYPRKERGRGKGKERGCPHHHDHHDYGCCYSLQSLHPRLELILIDLAWPLLGPQLPQQHQYSNILYISIAPSPTPATCKDIGLE